MTPQTSSRFRPGSPEFATPYTPSKSPRFATPGAIGNNATQATTTQGSGSEEEFYDWPTSDDDEISKVADQASSGHSIALPETPRKALKTDMQVTPGKRRYDDISMDGPIEPSALPTPSTVNNGDDIFATPAAGMPGKGLFTHGASYTPAETPTPIRYRNIPPTQDSELASEMVAALQTQNITLHVEAKEVLKAICNRHVLYTRGIMKGRDVSRGMVKTKDEKLAELQGEIEGLKAERETNRAVIRHLRRDIATRKQQEKT